MNSDQNALLNTEDLIFHLIRLSTYTLMEIKEKPQR